MTAIQIFTVSGSPASVRTVSISERNCYGRVVSADLRWLTCQLSSVNRRTKRLIYSLEQARPKAAVVSETTAAKWEKKAIISRDGSLIAFPVDGSVAVYETQTGKRVGH